MLFVLPKYRYKYTLVHAKREFLDARHVRGSFCGFLVEIRARKLRKRRTRDPRVVNHHWNSTRGYLYINRCKKVSYNLSLNLSTRTWWGTAPFLSFPLICSLSLFSSSPRTHKYHNRLLRSTLVYECECAFCLPFFFFSPLSLETVISASHTALSFASCLRKYRFRVPCAASKDPRYPEFSVWNAKSRKASQHSTYTQVSVKIGLDLMQVALNKCCYMVSGVLYTFLLCKFRYKSINYVNFDVHMHMMYKTNNNTTHRMNIEIDQIPIAFQTEKRFKPERADSEIASGSTYRLPVN
jgi:hypothetical protein